MATNPTRYIAYPEAVAFHIRLLRRLGESRFGVDHRGLIESALARPQQAATYENADMIRQAATLLYGLIKNHPWLGGNKRTASFLMKLFLQRNGLRLAAPLEDEIAIVYEVEADRWKVDEIEIWLQQMVVSNLS